MQHLQAQHGIAVIDIQLVDGLLGVGVGIPVAAVALDQLVEFRLAVARGTGKQQVLEKVRHLLPAAVEVVLADADDDAADWSPDDSREALSQWWEISCRDDALQHLKTLVAGEGAWDLVGLPLDSMEAIVNEADAAFDEARAVIIPRADAA